MSIFVQKKIMFYGAAGRVEIRVKVSARLVVISAITGHLKIVRENPMLMNSSESLAPRSSELVFPVQTSSGSDRIEM